MNTNESSTIASRGTRWQQQVLEGIIGLVALLAIIAGVVAGLDAFTADELTTPVNLESSAAATVEPNRAAGYQLELDKAELVIEDPSIADRLPIDAAATLSLLPLPAGFVLLAIAEVFRHGANLRDDVEGLV